MPNLGQPNAPALPNFSDFIRKAPNKHFKGVVLAFDPGETTGYATYESFKDGTKLRMEGLATGQVKTWPLKDAVFNFSNILSHVGPSKVVFESYQVYDWKKDEHSFSNIPTLQVIGCLQTLLIQRCIPFTSQSAQIAKQFVTDNKLESWGFWLEGKRHARDAMRHAIYWLTFGDAQQK